MCTDHRSIHGHCIHGEGDVSIYSEGREIEPFQLYIHVHFQYDSQYVLTVTRVKMITGPLGE